MATPHQQFQIRPKVKRSKGGCLTCRETHTKCDESKPSCSRCVRLQFKCVGTGYAYDPKELAQKTEAQRRLLHNQIISSAVHRPLVPSDGSIYLHHFVTNCAKGFFFLDDKADNPLSRKIYRHFAGCEHLQLAVSALSAGDLQRRQAGHKAKYHHFYGCAVRKLNEALSNPGTATSVATLVSVLLLGFCDISRSHSSAWLSHLQGARDLLVLQGGPRKEPLLACVFSLVDVGSSFFLGRETLLPTDYINDSFSIDIANTPGETWPCWDTTGWAVDRFSQRLRIVAKLAKLAFDAKRCLRVELRETVLAESRQLLNDISDHWSGNLYQREVGSLFKTLRAQREQLVIEDRAAGSACVLALIEITAPVINLNPNCDSFHDITFSPAIISYHIDTILLAYAFLDEPYCLAGLPWPLFMAGVHLFQDKDRERAVLEALKRVSGLPFEGAIRLLESMWQRQWVEGIRLNWRTVLQESGGLIYVPYL